MYRIGVDVGGTNTDAVVLDDQSRVIAEVKHPTTSPLAVGIDRAVTQVLDAASVPIDEITDAMFGTTQATNAIVERKRLNSVLVLRVGAPATSAVMPMTGWPRDLAEAIGGHRYLVGGGHEFDGRQIAALDEAEVSRILSELAGQVSSVAIVSVFSPVNDTHERRVAQMVREAWGEDFPVSLSCEIGSLGLLERENATILNAALVDVAHEAINGFTSTLDQHGIHAQLFLGQNDGTLMNARHALRYPILMIACGPTNSIRGASTLAEVSDAVVVDVGGTTTDVGFLAKGFPRQSSIAVEIGGVRTNFRMPDLVSVGLGGGSIVRERDGKVTVGPDSVGYELTSRARVFGGDDLTATDIAVAKGVAEVGDPSLVANLDPHLVDEAWRVMDEIVSDAIDAVKTSPAPIPIIVVGGGSIILSDHLPGDVVRPDHHAVANAIGAAIADVSGEVERIFTLDEISRQEAIAQACAEASQMAVDAGAIPDSVEIVHVEDVPLAYLPGNATRVHVKASGVLQKGPA